MSNFIHQPVAGDNEARRARARRKRQAFGSLPALAERMEHRDKPLVERIANHIGLYQALREAGDEMPEAAAAAITNLAAMLAERRYLETHPSVASKVLDAAFAALQYPGASPAAEEWQGVADAATADELERHGEIELAYLLRHNREEFSRVTRLGREQLP